MMVTNEQFEESYIEVQSAQMSQPEDATTKKKTPLQATG